ncbi:hypothetical protein ABL78_5413 [Leptomonas seymouri]|uniref:Uncharacterized protein n=1 Tax=Leptomonas seymouri TaxID=5684 RepID=A0A0N1HWW3_LEPSE|nr:hypothetical protein ABL78_5413 [Leptomonas seymouri]|eukprot:KPI85532.1 hypothetical protein ABL78_5413 [Leptomonas seymouri]
MDLDADIDRWRNQSRRSSYSSYYQRSNRGARSTSYDFSSKHYFRDDTPSPSSAAMHRRAPPPPPPPPPPSPPPPPPPAPSKPSRHAKKRSKRAALKRQSTKRWGRSVASSSSSSSADSSTATTARAVSSTSRGYASSSNASTTSTSSVSESYGTSSEVSITTSSSGTGSSDTGSDSTTYSSASAVSSHHHHHDVRHRKRKISLPRSLQAMLVRVAQRPGSAAQDEEIAAAAACRAILEKEAALKEKEMRLLQHKINFAAEVRQRSSLPHRLANEDEALRQMQRLVDLENPSPSLDDYLRRTASATKVIAPPLSAIADRNASTDAGALAYLRSHDPAAESPSMPSPNRVGGAHGKSLTAAAPSERTTVIDTTHTSPTAVAAVESGTVGSPAAANSAAVPASNNALPRAASALCSNSSLEHSLPVEGHLLIPSGDGTPTQHTDALSHYGALEATIQQRKEDSAAPALTIEADHTEEHQAPPLATSTLSGTWEQRQTAVSGTGTSAEVKNASVSLTATPSKPAEKHHQLSNSSNGGGGHIIHIEFPRRRVKVKVRRRRNASRSQPRAADTDSEEDEEREKSERNCRRSAPAKSMQSPEKAADAPPRQLLPPPPSPAINTTTNCQQFAVAPLQKFKVKGSGQQQQQPWATANWPTSTGHPGSGGGGGVAGISHQKPKDGPPALWYASNSPVPLSQVEFKRLLCSEYTPPELTYAVPPQDDEDVGSEGRHATEHYPPPDAARKPKAGRREFYEPYDDVAADGGERKTPLLMGASPTAGARRAENRRVSLRRRSVQVHDPTEEAETGVDELDGDGRAQDVGRGKGGDGEGGGANNDRAASPTQDEAHASHFLETADDPRVPPTPPAPVYAEDGESVVEFPPPPHLMASDMPPPGNVGSEDEGSCCGDCCGCWGRLFSCVFPCCCGPKD